MLTKFIDIPYITLFYSPYLQGAVAVLMPELKSTFFNKIREKKVEIYITSYKTKVNEQNAHIKSGFSGQKPS